MIVMMECSCHVWPIVLGNRVGRCGLCGEGVTHTDYPPGPVMCKHEGPCVP